MELSVCCYQPCECIAEWKVKQETFLQAMNLIMQKERFSSSLLYVTNLLITYGRKPYFVENGATPGVVLLKNVLSADDLPSRSTVAEGYDMVINDLEEVMTLNVSRRK